MHVRKLFVFLFGYYHDDISSYLIKNKEKDFFPFLCLVYNNALICLREYYENIYRILTDSGIIPVD